MLLMSEVPLYTCTRSHGAAEQLWRSAVHLARVCREMNDGFLGNWNE
jgi:hypothetical protein